MSSPLSSQVTFLFTDIEGSTRLWEQHPEAMKIALEHHDALLREVFDTHGGHVFKTVGDAFCAAFADAAAALAAAVDAQRRLNAQSRDELGQLRVRVALHCGDAHARDGDYFGLSLNRTARLLGAAHGGQILLSLAVETLIKDTLNGDISLKDLGRHRLKDLTQPEHVFQVVHPQLEKAFPPLRSLESKPHNLPTQLSSFIGRERELVEITSCLNTTLLQQTIRLLTLTGVGGCGKTRLALQAAAELLNVFADGVWLVELAPLIDPDQVPQAVADALGLKEGLGTSTLDVLQQHLANKETLLIMDNCEHVLDACAHLIEVILSAAPKLRVLATSREGLNLTGERRYQVPPLSVPDEATPPTLLKLLHEFESVALFVERARLGQPGFRLSDANTPSVIQICRRLDGLPLAIELAAARVRSLPLDQIAARLDDRFRLLTGGTRTALPRQQTLRATMDWSYNLLTPEEQTLFNRLAPFRGGFTVEAAESVCILGDNPDLVLDNLTQLVEKSLVVFEEHAHRYKLLEIAIQYAAEQLEADAAAKLRQRHFSFYLDVVETATPHLKGPDPATWFNQLAAEHDNVRAALHWAKDHDPVRGLALAVAFTDYWTTRGHASEGLKQIEAFTSRAQQAPKIQRAKALCEAGNLAMSLGQYDRAQTLLEQCLTLSRSLEDSAMEAKALSRLGSVAHERADFETARVYLEACQVICQSRGDQQAMAEVLLGLGNLWVSQGESERARAYYEESLSIARSLNDIGLIASLFHNIACDNRDRGQVEVALQMFEESLDICRQIGDRSSTALTLNNIGIAYVIQGKLDQAKDCLDEALDISLEIGEKLWELVTYCNLGDLALKQQRWQEAKRRFQESVEIAWQMEVKRDIAYALEGLAEVAVAHNQSQRAVQLFGAAAALRSALNAPLEDHIQQQVDQAIDRTRQQLGSEAFEQAWLAGEKMPLEEAVSLALSDPVEQTT